MASYKPKTMLYCKRDANLNDYKFLQCGNAPIKHISNLDRDLDLSHYELLIVELISYENSDNAIIENLIAAVTEQVKLLVVTENDIPSLAAMIKQYRNVSLVTKSGQLELTCNQAINELFALKSQRAANDGLIALPEEELFKQMLSRTLARAKRYHRATALLMLEIDDFTSIMQKLNNKISYRFAWEVAERLQNIVRENDIIYRLDMKQFAIILDQINDQLEAGLVARKINALIEEPFQVGEEEITINCNIGIACYPDQDNYDIKLYYNQAYIALQRAKLDNLCRFQYFNESYQEKDEHCMKMTKDLEKGIENNEFHAKYQPIFNLTQGNLLALETLIDWQHPGIDVIGAKAFIPLAEKANMMPKLNQWLLSHTDKQASKWLRNSGDELKIFFKLSPHLLLNKDYTTAIENALEKLSMPKENIVFEIKEHCLMKNKNELDLMFNSLSRFNCEICINHFGKGHLSLNDLQRQKINYVKLASDFLHDLPHNEDNANMAKALISMANNLNIEVIASDVDNKQQLEFLTQHHCQFGSGQLLSKTLAVTEVDEFITSNNNTQLIRASNQ